ncbi:MAG: hypothetical protein Q9183_005141 [Haloplaca sp. 2 TL-2023]
MPSYYSGGTGNRKLDKHNRKLGAQIWNRYRRDHPEACGGAITPVPSQPFHFLDLPLKLKHAIYGFILRVPAAVRQMEPDGTANDTEGPIDARIFAISKNIHEEAIDAFFRGNVVSIPLGDDGRSGHPPLMFRDDASDIRQGYVKKIVKVNMIMPTHGVSEVPRLRWILERVCQVLVQSPRLEEVRVTPCTQSSWHQPELDIAIDDVLETVTLLQAKCSVTFSDEDTLSAEIFRGEYCILGTEAQRERLCSIVNGSKEYNIEV